MTTWKRDARDLWTVGPLSICRQLDERTRAYAYELYESTRFVGSFATLAAAMEHAEGLGWQRVAS